jgi:hypothetical protein
MAIGRGKTRGGVRVGDIFVLKSCLMVFFWSYVFCRFISFDDMQDLVGGSMSDDLEKIWIDSLQECKAHMDCITYSDFKRLMKGQPKETNVAASCDATSLRSSETSLQSVPEGNMQSLADIPPVIDEDAPLIQHPRTRSFDLQDSPKYDSIRSLPPTALTRDASLALLLPSKAEGEYGAAINDSSMSSLVVNRTMYRKHREMRLAVQEASKEFDLSRNQRRSSISNSVQYYTQAGLIMKRGALPPVELEDAHQRALFAAAAKRCGRGRKTRTTRTRTVSDITGMMLKGQAA